MKLIALFISAAMGAAMGAAIDPRQGPRQGGPSKTSLGVSAAPSTDSSQATRAGTPKGLGRRFYQEAEFRPQYGSKDRIFNPTKNNS